MPRKERHRYQQGDLELKEAVTNISHDLRTPLTAISGYLDLLEGEEKNFEPLKNVDSFEDAFEKQVRVNSTYIGTDQTIYIMKPKTFY